MRCARAVAPGLEGDRRRLDNTAARLNLHTLRRDIDSKRRDLDGLTRRLSDAATRQQQGWHDRLAGLDRLRETLGYKATLKRGYAVVRGDGRCCYDQGQGAKARCLAIEFADGVLGVGRMRRETRAQSPKPKDPPPDQGSLF